MEVDPDRLKMLRSIEWDRNYLSAMILTPEEDALYCQCSLWDELTKVNVESFEIEKVLKGDRHARCLTLDPKRNIIYVLGYCSGKVSAVDLETGGQGVGSPGGRTPPRHVPGRPGQALGAFHVRGVLPGFAGHLSKRLRRKPVRGFLRFKGELKGQSCKTDRLLSRPH